ncbi:RNA-directed DNA polymerase [bacterium]|nr:RNA-directed DNA polymerase [bacterium]
MGKKLKRGEAEEIQRLAALGLPPITSRWCLGTMLGVNAGIFRSMELRPHRYYRNFRLASGNKVRNIRAPKAGLKVVQRWIAHNLANAYVAPDHVYGFVSGRSHIDAAMQHVNASWVVSVDISDFFPSTPVSVVRSRLLSIGYQEVAANLITSLVTYEESLPQGAPTSPVLSNICFGPSDLKMAAIAEHYDARITRYADDIVFSGETGIPHADILVSVRDHFERTCWDINERKVRISQAPNRRKVHGLLVHGGSVRLTKGYRNRIRAYKHLLNTRSDIPQEDYHSIMGHVSYADHLAELVGKSDSN